MARVLVIEDDPQMRSLMRQMLERVGHAVAEAPDGKTGLQAFARCASDLAVVDLYMPEQSGWETIRALHRMAPGLPIVVVSGGAALEGLRKGSSGTLDAARRVGGFRTLLKPFTWGALTTAVAELLAGPRQAEAGGSL